MSAVAEFPADKTAPQTATVETLIAEVRVLMVGNRQITMSVAKQLDWVDECYMEPFGRIKLYEHSRLLIGKHIASGVLVRSTIPESPNMPYIDRLSAHITVCRTLKRDCETGACVLNLNNNRLKFAPGVIRYCEIDGHDAWIRAGHCDGWIANGMEDEISNQILEFKKYKEHIAALNALPLIVLAGLR